MVTTKLIQMLIRNRGTKHPQSSEIPHMKNTFAWHIVLILKSLGSFLNELGIFINFIQSCPLFVRLDQRQLLNGILSNSYQTLTIDFSTITSNAFLPQVLYYYFQLNEQKI